MNNEIAVAEYSKITGLSRKTIYDKINKGKLSVVEGRGENNRPQKYIVLNISVDEFRKLGKDKEKQEETEVKNVNNVNEDGEVNEVNNPVNEVKDEVNEVNNHNYLEEEQAPKAESSKPTATEQFLLDEIKDLREQIKEKDKQLLEFANKFAELAKQSNLIAEKAIHTTGQAQILQAVNKKQQGISLEPGEQIPIVEEKIGYKEPEDGEKPKGFWKRLAYWFTH